jgi:hypothetical protein
MPCHLNGTMIKRTLPPALVFDCSSPNGAESKLYHSTAAATIELYGRFKKNYEPSEDRTSARFVEINRTLLIDLFVEQMTLLHILARNIARDLLADADEEVQFDLRVDGLAGRTLAANRLDPMKTFLICVPGHTGTENVFNFPLRTTLRALEVEAVSVARDRCARVLWTFGLDGNAMLSMQRSLLGGTEPIALPPP